MSILFRKKMKADFRIIYILIKNIDFGVKFDWLLVCTLFD
jgi:hypothetical protein